MNCHWQQLQRTCMKPCLANHKSPAGDEKEERHPRARWVMLAILSFDICVSYIPYYTFVPILRQSMQVYSVDEPALNILCILYALVYVPGAFLTAPIVASLGCRWTFVLATALLSLGCAIRCGPGFFGPSVSVLFYPSTDVMPASFWWLLIGQTLCACGQPLLVNTTSEMGAEWFPPSERPTAAMLSNLMNFLGGSVSFIIPPLVVEENGEKLDVTETQMQHLLQLQFLIAVLSFLITLLLYQPAPLFSTSAHRDPVPLHMEIIALFKMRDFWLVNGYFSIFVALCHAFDAVEGSLLEHYGYSAALSSWTGAACGITSILSSILESRWINHPSSYRLALCIASIFLAASQLIAFLGLHFQMSGNVFIFAIAVMGLSTPGWGCSCELASEVCFPARESTVNSILEAFSNLMGVLGIILVQHLLDIGMGGGVLIMMALAAFLGSFLLVCMKGQLLRNEAEADFSAQDDERQQDIADRSPVRLKDVPKSWPRQHLSSITTSMVVFFVLYIVSSLIPQGQLPEFMEEKLQEYPQANVLTSNSASADNSSWLDVTGHLANGLPEPQNFVINCKEDERRLNRFVRHMHSERLNVTVFRCVRGTAAEVNRLVSANLLPSSATMATEGMTRNGLERSALIGRASAHISLWKTIIDNDIQVANIFEDDEVVHKKFRAKRNMLLGKIPAKVDFVKLNTFQPSGKKKKLKGVYRGWARDKVFQLRPRLSAFTNLWMSNYVVTRTGASKLLKFGESYDTFDVGAIFDMHIMSAVYGSIKQREFLGFAVGTNVLSHHCEDAGFCYKVLRGKHGGDVKVTNCNRTKVKFAHCAE